MADPIQWGVYRTAVTMQARGGKKGDHLVIVVQSPELIAKFATVQVVPITSDWGGPKTLARCIPQRRNDFLDHDSWALVHLVGNLEKKKLSHSELGGTLHPTDVAQVKAALMFLFDLH